MIDFSILTNHWETFLKGFGNTLLASLIAIIGSLLIGAVIAVCRISPIPPLRWFGTLYTELIRNIPLLLLVFLFFYGFKMGGFTSGTIALTIYTASFIAEAIRAGIMSISKGQTEAARSSGLTYLQTMRYVILPQAIKVVIPPIGNQFLNLVKNSSILSVVAGLDVMYYADIISSETFVVFSVYIFVAMFYLIITVPISFAVGYLERRLAISN
jgi:putative glutamine transport system permease protein